MSQLYEVLDRYVEDWAVASPIGATGLGVPGHDDRMDDFSPDGAAAAAEIDRRAVSSLEAIEVESERERVAKEAMLETLATSLEEFDQGEHLRSLNILGSPLQSVRRVFDLMPTQTEEHWRNVATRLSLVPECMGTYRRALLQGLAEGKVAARRQVTECAEQARVWSGGAEQPSFFSSLVDAYDKGHQSSSALRSDLVASARAASEAYSDMRDFLLEAYLPGADERDAVGAERYKLASRSFNGIELDPIGTYQWGWEQLEWVESEMKTTAERILPGEGVDAAKNLLETDPARAIEGADPLRAWAQDLLDKTIEDLDGTHFDIPDAVKRMEVMIAPPGGALTPYYTPPSEDFSRPGRFWFPTGTQTRFPLWWLVSLAYHEGVPGHHFQLGTSKYLSTELSRPQRLAITATSGNAEGWALYAERLMGELGYLENPDYYLGMLKGQALRCVRVVIDIGMHLELEIPRDRHFHPGEVWTPELGLEFALERSHVEAELMNSELVRYLGLPAQAISYKVGEKAWLEAREEARRRSGPSFDLKQFHAKALGLGPMGLAQMQRELAGV